MKEKKSIERGFKFLVIHDPSIHRTVQRSIDIESILIMYLAATYCRYLSKYWLVSYIQVYYIRRQLLKSFFLKC